MIRAEVGDTIKVVYRNGCPFRPPCTRTGVLRKDSEGALSADGTGGSHT